MYHKNWQNNNGWWWRLRIGHADVQFDIIQFELFWHVNFDVDIANNNNFKSFEYRAKLLGNTVAAGNDTILENKTIALPLKYLSNFWQSLEITSINCNVELRLRSTKH